MHVEEAWVCGCERCQSWQCQWECGGWRTAAGAGTTRRTLNPLSLPSPGVFGVCRFPKIGEDKRVKQGPVGGGAGGNDDNDNDGSGDGKIILSNLLPPAVEAAAAPQMSVNNSNQTEFIKRHNGHEPDGDNYKEEAVRHKSNYNKWPNTQHFLMVSLEDGFNLDLNKTFLYS